MVGRNTMSLTTQKVADNTGASTRQLNYWSRMQYVRPKVISGSGPSTGLLWDEKESEIARLMVKLIQVGFTAQRSAKLARLIVENPTPQSGHRISLGHNMKLVVMK